jgi:hypothetical protein
MKKSAEADPNAEQDRVIRECLGNEEKLKSLNDTMARTIATEVYDLSLARALLLPHLCYGGGYSPVYQETDAGPVVMVDLVRTEERVLHCRAFRDSLCEEETVRTRQDIRYLTVRGKARPSSFTLSCVCTAKRTELWQRPYATVERARQHLLRSLAQDETRVMLRALAWVCSRFGTLRWCARPQASLLRLLGEAVQRSGMHRSPVILCSPLAFARILNLRIARLASDPSQDRPSQPIAAIEVEGQTIPVYVNQSIPNHLFYVIPSGAALGQMPIFSEVKVENYDRRERLIKGWQLWQGQGMVFVRPRSTNVVYFGWRGLLAAVKSLLGWGNS